MKQEMHGAPVTDALLRLPQVVELTGRSKTRIYEDMAAGRMPRPVKIGVRAVAWRASALQAWIRGRTSGGEQ